MTPGIVPELNPPRLPASVVATHWADLLAAFGLGLLLAALLAVLVAPLLRPRPRRESVAARLARARTLAPAERLIAQLNLLQETGTPLPADLRAALYTAMPPDPEALDALVARRRHA
jgi:hypothetical protein